MEITRAEMAEKLKHIRQARIYFHKKPDGDAVGAAYGLALGLQAHGIPCELRCSDPVPAAYRWMTDQVPTCALEQPTEIAVDTAAPGRLGRYKDQPIDLCIDHHEGNTIQAAYKYVVPEASSCSELVFWLLRDMGTVITPEIASLLYTGLVTDTSAFRSRSTNAASLKAAAELASCGAPVARLPAVHPVQNAPAHGNREGPGQQLPLYLRRPHPRLLLLLRRHGPYPHQRLRVGRSECYCGAGRRG